MSKNMHSSGRGADFVALIDPYWLLGRGAPPDEMTLRAVAAAMPGGANLARVYWYLEFEGAHDALRPIAHVTVRPCARDDLDDGFELVRSMAGDLRELVTGGRFEGVVVASLDDRLAVSLEHAKSSGLQVFGCRATAEEQDQRMLRLFDEMIEPRFERSISGKSDDSVSEQAASIIKIAIGHWHTEADALEVERVRQFIAARSGLPRPVDSRLLFLVSQQLGRELSVDERIALRQRFRESCQGLI
jgi:hypothetical protein